MRKLTGSGLALLLVLSMAAWAAGSEEGGAAAG